MHTGIILDFKNGSTLQCACETRREQVEVFNGKQSLFRYALRWRSFSLRSSAGIFLPSVIADRNLPTIYLAHTDRGTALLVTLSGGV